MHFTVLIYCTEPITFVCAHFDQISHSPSFQASVDCIHHHHRNFGLDREFFVKCFTFFWCRFCQNSNNLLNSGAVRIKYSFTSNCFDAYSHYHLLRISASIWIFSGYKAVFNFSLIVSCSRSNSAAFPCASLSTSVHPCSNCTLQRW